MESLVSFELNWWAVLVVAVLHMALGAFWYSPAGFGKKWMHYMGFTMESMEKHKKDMWKSYLIAFIGALLTSFMLAQFVDAMGADTFWMGAQVGFWLWLGFIVPSQAASFLWEGKKVELYLINIFYHAVALMVGGGILVEWVI